MRVFVAGASGVIGRALVPQLVAAGHEVTGMTRSDERAGLIREAGAEAVVADVFEEQRVRDAVAASGAEAVIHQLTALPAKLDFKDPEKSYGPTNRLRIEGTRILVEAARAAGARRLIAQSIAFVYAPEGNWVKDESAPVVATPGPFGDVTRSVLALESAVTEAQGIEGLVLRYGFLYGPGSYYAPDGSQAEDFRKRRFPVVGKGTGVFSFIHADDAASATVAAVERGEAGIYNVADDEPAPVREWAPVYAAAIGAPKPLRIPRFVARLAAPAAALDAAEQMRGASNAKARRALDWAPRYASWRQGFAEGLG